MKYSLGLASLVSCVWLAAGCSDHAKAPPPPSAAVDVEDNIYGQLGLGDTVWRGDNASEMGDNLAAVSLF